MVEEARSRYSGPAVTLLSVLAGEESLREGRVGDDLSFVLLAHFTHLKLDRTEESVVGELVRNHIKSRFLADFRQISRPKVAHSNCSDLPFFFQLVERFETLFHPHLPAWPVNLYFC